MTRSKRHPRRAAGPAPAPPTVTSAPMPKGKIGAIVELLSRPEGCTIAEMQTATGWQPHSVRGAIAGHVKKKLGLAVQSEKAEGGRVYRIRAEAGA